MTPDVYSVMKTDYPFLAHPPPQKKRPLQPLPSPPCGPSLQFSPIQAARAPRRRSNTFSAIASWAAHVQPGSPASLSPRSPHRRPSIGKGRRPSIVSTRAPSASFLHITPTPTTTHFTPSIRDFKADLTTVGYTSVFFHLLNTPVSAAFSFSVQPKPVKNVAIPRISSPVRKPRGFSRFCSLSVLQSRGRSRSVGPNSPTKMRAKVIDSSAAILKRKRTKYAMRPPPFINELALMQFADGGSMDNNIKRVMGTQARAAGAVGLSDIYRDGEGGLWWDRDEEWEYAHLLTEGDESRPCTSGDLPWVTFGSTTPSATGMPAEERRGSVSTQDSDLDPKYKVEPTDEDDLALFGGAVAPVVVRKSISVLSLPSRRTAKHLQKPDLLVSAAFSRHHTSPQKPKLLTSSGMDSGVLKPKGKSRRRPAPLNLSPPGQAWTLLTNSPIDVDRVRRDFIEASFDPTVDSVSVAPMTATPHMKIRTRLAESNVPWRTVNDGAARLRMKKPSMLNMMGLFRSARREEEAC